MPEYFATQLREGTGQVAESLALPTAAQVRRQGEARGRRRRFAAVAATMSAVLLVGGVAFGVSRPDVAATNRAAAASRASANAPIATATMSAASGGAVGVRLTPPAEYAASTSNKVELTIDNPGSARQVVVEFKATQTKSLYWVEPCDNSVGGGCNKTDYADNPLKVAKGALSSTPGIAAFDLALPTGISTYTAFVDLPAGVTSYSVLVLDGATVLGETSSGPISHGFPTLDVVGPTIRKITPGGAAVEFDTKLTDDTSASYIDIFSFTTLTCGNGPVATTIPQSSYTLEWYTGANWAAVGPTKALGQFSYAIAPGETTTTRFRLAFTTALPYAITSCRVTQLVSATDTWTAPYYDESAPRSQTAVGFSIEWPHLH